MKCRLVNHSIIAFHTKPVIFFTIGIFVICLASVPFTMHPTFAKTNTLDKVSSSIIQFSLGTEVTFKPTTLETLGWFETDSHLIFDDHHYQAEIENLHRCPLPNTAALLCDLFANQTTRTSLRSTTSFSVQEKPIRAYLEKLNNDSVLKQPIDAKFIIQDGRVAVFSQGIDGRRINIDKTLTDLHVLLGTENPRETITVPLALDTLSPTIHSNDADKLGIVELISEGRTNFTGSPKNRIHNFTLGAQQFNGLLIPPNTEFSFIEHLGPVDGEHGYLPELVIKQNVTTPEFGGGICQVSTTAFRAALNAGLKITMRRNHAYPVQYYKPYGMDATVYIPKPDLRFINNTPGSILIQTIIEGSDLVFRFYGTSDGRKTAIDGPHILAAPGNGSMKTVFTQTVTTTDGSTLINDKFYSSYAPASRFPHPGQTATFTSKPDDWSEKQWAAYRREHNL